MSGRAMTAAEVADHLRYLTRAGEPNTRLVYQLAREAEAGNRRFPLAIDPSLPSVQWRWSSVQVESYAAGEWRDDTPSPTPLRGAA